MKYVGMDERRAQLDNVVIRHLPNIEPSRNVLGYMLLVWQSHINQPRMLLTISIRKLPSPIDKWPNHQSCVAFDAGWTPPATAETHRSD